MPQSNDLFQLRQPLLTHQNLLEGHRDLLLLYSYPTLEAVFFNWPACNLGIKDYEVKPTVINRNVILTKL
jgi:hypothetical protein